MPTCPDPRPGLLRELGHDVEDVRDILPNGVEDAKVAAYARTNQLILITRDFDFADIRNYPPKDYEGIIVLELPEDAIAAQANQILRSFAGHPQFLARLAGRLAIVETWRVRFRPNEATD